MENYSIHLPSYSIGKDVYKEIPEICGKYGNKIVAIGGHKALAAAKDKILEAIKDSSMEIIDFLWYGGEATYENVEKLMENPAVIKLTLDNDTFENTGKSRFFERRTSRVLY